MSTFRLTIEYQGTHFSGWQRQPNVRTVQGVLEQSLATLLRQEVPIQGAGRTDAGVHAIGQAASFEAETAMAPEKIRKGLTALSRPEIAVVETVVAPDGWNARFAAQGKHYRYTVLSRPSPSPIHRDTSYFIPVRLDRAVMREAAAKLIGTHDFAGFRASDCGRDNTIRELSEISISSLERGFIHIDVKGTAFLKNMVRIIAGTLIEVGKGRLSPDIVDEVLASGDRTIAGPTAPAHGLTLMRVYY